MAHLSRIEIFLQVVKHNSFIGAAKQLGMTGAAVSKHIQSLEAELGVRLLNRTTRLVSLTEEGSAYSVKAEKALNDLHEAELELQEFKACPSGPLKISAPVTFGIKYLTKPICAFAKAYPHVELDISFDDRRVDLYAENIDAAIRIGVLEDSNLIAKRIYHCPIILCASKSFADKHKSIVLPTQLSELPAVVFNRHNNEGVWRYRANDNNEQGAVRFNKTLMSNTAEMMLQACLTGIGIAALPIFVCAEYLNSGELVQMLPNYRTAPEPDIYIVYKDKQLISRRLQLFIESLLDQVNQLPW